MSLIQRRRQPRVSPWQELDDLTHQLGAFGDRWNQALQGSAWFPAVNIEENRDEIVLTAELPGVRREDVEIEFENQVLTLRGRKEESRTEGEEGRALLWERRSGSFGRSFALPRTVSGDSIEAIFADGVLRVRMPKVPEAKGRKIEIRTEG